MIPKFRAWHKTQEELGEVERIRFDDEGNVSTVLVIGKSFGANIYIDKIELMQSTGLKDKNGKEIFEGDILEIQGIRMAVKFGSYKYLEPLNRGCQSFDVMYDGLGFYVKTFNTIALDDISPFEPETLKNSQIIGNIYENPELLEEKE